MFQKVGKYKIYKGDDYLRIKYRYTFTDYLGVLWYLVSLIMGALLFTVAIYIFSYDDITNILMLLIGFGLILFSARMILMSLYSPANGVFEIRHDINKVIIRDFLKKEMIDIDSIFRINYKIETYYRPKQRFAMIYLNTYDNKKIECFIIRSHHSVDNERIVVKELHHISKTICNIISEEIS